MLRFSANNWLKRDRSIEGDQAASPMHGQAKKVHIGDLLVPSNKGRAEHSAIQE